MDKEIALAGDVIRDILIPAEGRSRLLLGKESDAEEPLAKSSAIEMTGGASFVHRVLEELLKSDDKFKNASGFDALVSSAVHPLETAQQPLHSTHWTLDLFPETPHSSDSSIYRVYERSISINQNREYVLHEFTKNEVRDPHPILVVQDYARDTRQWLGGNYLNTISPGVEKFSDYPVRRILGLAHRLPIEISGAPSVQSESSDDGLWKTVLKQLGEDKEKVWKNNTKFSETLSGKTVVITGLDRLRQDGAFVSKRKSWDRTVDDLYEEANRYRPLSRLTEFGHLFIRIGVSAVAHFYRDDEFHRKLRFYYDPLAEGVYFRDLARQGNVFSIRSVLPSILAKAALNLKGETSINKIVDEFGESASTAIGINQQIYLRGFGETLSQVREYGIRADTSDSTGNSVIRSKDLTKAKSKLINRVKVPRAPFVLPWALLSGNMRADICVTGDQPDMTVERQLRGLEDLRRLRCARLIVHGGIDQVVNQRSNKDDAKGNSWNSQIKNALEDERKGFFRPIERTGLGFRHGLEEIDGTFIEEDVMSPIQYSQETQEPVSIDDSVSKSEIEYHIKEISKIAKRSNYLPPGLTSRLRPEYEWERINAHLKELKNTLQSYPFNFPTTRFGALTVVGQRDIENFSNVWNRLRAYLAERESVSRPLNIAVFGPPGTGKSFGIKQMAKSLSREFEELTFNLSQFDGRDLLNRAMLQISNVITRGNIPLVFFDEFDANLGGDALGWLRYFLEPMQDGSYQHPDSELRIFPSVLVFAGGTTSSSHQFISQLETTDPQEQKRFASAKLKDFVSRISSYIDIPLINPEYDSKGFPTSHSAIGESEESSPRTQVGAKRKVYLRRALILRGMLRQKKLIRDSNLDRAVKDRGKQDTGRALLDDAIARAFLTVSEYRHGARSLEAILDSCVPFHGRIIKASLPTYQQMELHTHGMEFMVRVNHPYLIWIHRHIALFPKESSEYSPLESGSWSKLNEIESGTRREIYEEIFAILNAKLHAWGYEDSDEDEFQYPLEADRTTGGEGLPSATRMICVHLNHILEFALDHETREIRIYCWKNSERSIPSMEHRQEGAEFLKKAFLPRTEKKDLAEDK